MAHLRGKSGTGRLVRQRGSPWRLVRCGRPYNTDPCSGCVRDGLIEIALRPAGFAHYLDPHHTGAGQINLVHPNDLVAYAYGYYVCDSSWPHLATLPGANTIYGLYVRMDSPPGYVERLGSGQWRMHIHDVVEGVDLVFDSTRGDLECPPLSSNFCDGDWQFQSSSDGNTYLLIQAQSVEGVAVVDPTALPATVKVTNFSGKFTSVDAVAVASFGIWDELLHRTSTDTWSNAVDVSIPTQDGKFLDCETGRLIFTTSSSPPAMGWSLHLGGVGASLYQRIRWQDWSAAFSPVLNGSQLILPDVVYVGAAP